MANDRNLSVSRRRVVSGTAAAAAVLAAVPAGAIAAEPSGPKGQLAQHKVYPEPPFKPQSQPWPGLASKMDPKPDHGESSYVGSGRLVGRKALVTGGDSGIGRAAAIAFAREGADVAINYLPEEEPDAREVIALIKNAGRKAAALPGDIRQESVCNKLIADTHDRLGGIDILVNVAGRQQSHASLLDIDTDQFDWTMKTNLYAMFWLVKAALPHLTENAAIINTASEQGYLPDQDLVDYAMTKAAIVNFTKSMAKQLGNRKIRVNAVAPGPVWTPLQVTGGATEPKIMTFGSDVALGRPGQPAELAPVYVDLASYESSYVTGQIYGVTGGRGVP
jgi:hypothetical protein